MSEEFVFNPSNITKELVKIVLKLNDKYEKQLKGILNRFKAQVKYRLYLKEEYKEYYSFLKSYKLDKKGLKELFLEFEKLYDKLLFNNFALAYAYTLGKDIDSCVLTKEDERILLLQKDIKKFKKEFGHYALNAYELSSKRFSEYSDKELVKLQKLVKNIKIKDKIKLEKYLEQKNKKIIPILIALRELAKYNVLFVVNEIREELLKCQKQNNLRNIFNLGYDEIIGL